MKVVLPIIKKMDLALKYIPMVICIWANFKTTKNMVTDNSFGLICLQRSLDKILTWNITKAIGGVVFLMVKECIRK